MLVGCILKIGFWIEVPLEHTAVGLFDMCISAGGLVVDLSGCATWSGELSTSL